jgi:hypothetical protein
VNKMEVQVESYTEIRTSGLKIVITASTATSSQAASMLAAAIKKTLEENASEFYEAPAVESDEPIVSMEDAQPGDRVSEPEVRPDHAAGHVQDLGKTLFLDDNEEAFLAFFKSHGFVYAAEAIAKHRASKTHPRIKVEEDKA